jgi:hypothetical protein
MSYEWWGFFNGRIMDPLRSEAAVLVANPIFYQKAKEFNSETTRTEEQKNSVYMYMTFKYELYPFDKHFW